LFRNVVASAGSKTEYEKVTNNFPNHVLENDQSDLRVR
jgi:hypothetical protein